MTAVPMSGSGVADTAVPVAVVAVVVVIVESRVSSLDW